MKCMTSYSTNNTHMNGLFYLKKKKNFCKARLDCDQHFLVLQAAKLRQYKSRYMHLK